MLKIHFETRKLYKHASAQSRETTPTDWRIEATSLRNFIVSCIWLVRMLLYMLYCKLFSFSLFEAYLAGSYTLSHSFAQTQCSLGLP